MKKKYNDLISGNGMDGRSIEGDITNTSNIGSHLVKLLSIVMVFLQYQIGYLAKILDPFISNTLSGSLFQFVLPLQDIMTGCGVEGSARWGERSHPLISIQLARSSGWELTSTWKRCGERSRVMCSAFCCV